MVLLKRARIFRHSVKYALRGPQKTAQFIMKSTIYLLFFVLVIILDMLSVCICVVCIEYHYNLKNQILAVCKLNDSISQTWRLGVRTTCTCTRLIPVTIFSLHGLGRFVLIRLDLLLALHY